MKRIVSYITISLLCGVLEAQASDPQEGYAIIKSDTIYGQIKMNFEAGSIVVKQDSINRMFLSGVERITILNDARDTYLPIVQEGKTFFYKILVDGEVPLLEKESNYFAFVNQQTINVMEEKDLYDLFGKRDVKDYVFVRNIALSEQRGMVDVFRYFNKHESF